ncbi:hypothetical protein LSCM1_04091 [Leishmania martiniquensis]|uniref:Uncharacterized protein n=1 Tax=Leishmania martiniquensis TaxID=1580590 RepID=A0A836H7E9_9TRYP|nr:hypothetical protein LSCM1_04091 [Leishmania martiniquensis]
MQRTSLPFLCAAREGKRASLRTVSIVEATACRLSCARTGRGCAHRSLAFSQGSKGAHVQSSLWYSCRDVSASAWRLAPEVSAGGSCEDPFAFEFDPVAGVRHDAAVETAKKSLESIVEELSPPNASSEALAKIRSYLKQHPVDTLIVHSAVQITHIENPDTGAEERVHLSPMDIKEALKQAQLRNMNLVLMGARGDELAYCRIRRERPWVWKLVQPEMDLVSGLTGTPATGDAVTAPQQEQQKHGTGSGDGEADRPRQYLGKTKELVDHAFRDAVDAHFIGWRSKKIVQDIRKGHPVKLTIRDFQSPEAAVHKLREMSNAVKSHAEEQRVYHHFTSIVGNDREASLTLSPPMANKSGTISKTVKHPSEKEWAHTLKRMEDACQKAGRSGTYVKSSKLKMRNVGATTYRVDKYGRRVD